MTGADFKEALEDGELGAGDSAIPVETPCYEFEAPFVTSCDIRHTSVAQPDIPVHAPARLTQLTRPVPLEWQVQHP